MHGIVPSPSGQNSPRQIFSWCKLPKPHNEVMTIYNSWGSVHLMKRNTGRREWISLKLRARCRARTNLFKRSLRTVPFSKERRRNDDVPSSATGFFFSPSAEGWDSIKSFSDVQGKNDVQVSKDVNNTKKTGLRFSSGLRVVFFPVSLKQESQPRCPYFTPDSPFHHGNNSPARLTRVTTTPALSQRRRIDRKHQSLSPILFLRFSRQSPLSKPWLFHRISTKSRQKGDLNKERRWKRFHPERLWAARVRCISVEILYWSTDKLSGKWLLTAQPSIKIKYAVSVYGAHMSFPHGRPHSLPQVSRGQL